MKKKLIGVLAGFLVVMLLFTLLSRAADSLGIARVTTAKPERRSITHEVSAAGKVMQNQEQAVYTEMNQRVKAISVKEGEAIEAGDVLFEIDETDLEEQILIAKEDIEKQQLQRQDSISSQQAGATNKANEQANATQDYNDAVASGDVAVQQAKDALDAAKKELKDYKEPKQTETEKDTVLESLQNTVEEKQIAYDAAVAKRDELEKQIELAETPSEQAVTEFDEATEQEKQAKVELDNAETALNAYQANQNVANTESVEVTKEQLEQKVEEAKATYDQAVRDKETGVKSAARGVQSAAAAEGSNSTAAVAAIDLGQAERKLEKLETLKEQGGKIISPVKGIVTKINITVGERTTDGTAVMLADISSGLQFMAQVPSNQDKYIARKDEVVLKPDNNGKEVTGLFVDSLSVNGEDSSLLDVTVHLPEDTLEMGTGATLKVTKASEAYDTCVPLNALYQDSYNQYYVLVMEESESILGIQQTVRRVDVTVLDKNTQYAALAGGVLAAEQDIVVSSEKALEAGDRVRLNES